MVQPLGAQWSPGLERPLGDMSELRAGNHTLRIWPAPASSSRESAACSAATSSEPPVGNGEDAGHQAASARGAAGTVAPPPRSSRAPDRSLRERCNKPGSRQGHLTMALALKSGCARAVALLALASDLLTGDCACWAIPDVLADHDEGISRWHGELAKLTAQGRRPRLVTDGFACEGDGRWRRSLSDASQDRVRHQTRGELAMVWRP
jgi:hypothetical protein